VDGRLYECSGFLLIDNSAECRDIWSVVTDTIDHSASALGCTILHVCGAWDEKTVCAADGRAGAIVCTQCIIAAEDRLVQDGDDFAVWAVCVRCMVGVWDGCGE